MNKILLLGLLGAPLLVASCESARYDKAQASSAEVANPPEITLAIGGMT